MNLTRLSSNDHLGLADTVLTNAQEETSLMEALATRNFDQTKIDVGTAHYAAAKNVDSSLKATEGESKALTVELNACQKETQKEYIHLLEHARLICIDDPKTADKLGVYDKRKQSPFFDWASQAQQFFNGVLGSNKMLDAFTDTGILPEEIQRVKEMLDNVIAIKKKKQLAVGRVQTLREERKTAMKTLLNWLKKFLLVLEYAVKDNPQQLEKVGVQVYTDAYRAWKRSQAKAKETNTNPCEEPTDPGNTEPGTTDPGSTNPGSTDPGSTEPGSTEPGSTDPGATDPGTTEPGSTVENQNR